MHVSLIALNSSYTHTAAALYQLAAVSDAIADISIKEFTINDEVDYILSEIYASCPDVVGFSCYIWNIGLTLRLCASLKKILPGIVIILGGPEVSYDAVELLSDYSYIDYIVSGEGEQAFARLLKHLQSESSAPENIEGLYWRDGDEIHGYGFAVLSDLNAMPTMACALDYADAINSRIIYYETSRGCPYKCSYCLSSTTEGVRYLAMDKVKADLDAIMQSGTKQLKFLDRTFNANKKRAVDIWRYIVDNPKRLPDMRFHFEICADIIDDEMLDFLVTVPSGIFQFEIGIQSANEAALSAVGRRADIKRLEHVVSTLAEQGNIRLHLDLIAGLPAEDFTSFGRSFDFAYSLRPDTLQLGFLKLLKGSRLRAEVKRFGYAYDDCPPYEVLYNDYMSFKEMCELHWIEDALNRYYNSGRLNHVLNYMTKNYYSSPFDFYRAFGRYWHDKGFYGRTHKDEIFYDIMFRFIDDNRFQPRQLLSELLRADYLLRHPSTSHPAWLAAARNKSMKAVQKDLFADREFVRRYMPHFSDAEPKIIARHAYIEPFDYDIASIIASDYKPQYEPKPTWLLIDTSLGNIYNVSRETYFSIG